MLLQHIGIVACSAEGAALCYRTICSEGASTLGPHAHPEVSMHTYPLSHYMQCIRQEDWKGVADLMISSAEKLAGIGADFAICPDNTIHQAFDMAVSETNIPWLHIAEEVARVGAGEKYKRVAILGTKYLMEGPVYPSKLEMFGIEHLVPTESQKEKINEIIFDELVYGKFNSESRKYFSDLIRELKDKGCDAVVLGCTEIPLLVTQEDAGLPILDSTRILARAALKAATSGALVQSQAI